MKRNFFLILIVCLSAIFVSTAFAASTFKRVGANPFCRPPLTSEADLGTLLKSHGSQIKTGFAKAGYLNLYRAFSDQFPSAAIDSIKVSPGETFKWMLFKKKGTGPVIVSKDVTWGGAGPLDAYRFYVDRKGKRYEFVVLHACGNLALRNVTKTTRGKTPATSGKTAPAAQLPMPSSDRAAAGLAAPSKPLPAVLGKTETGPAGAGVADKAAAAPAGAMPGAVDKAAAGPAGGAMPGVSDKAVAAPAGAMPGAPESAAAGAGISAPSASEKAAPASTAATLPSASDRETAASAAATAAFLHNTVVDVGFSHQNDPASYLFVRMGYEFPLADKFSLMAYLGGYFRIHGYDGGSAVVADAILDYHWWNRLSFGIGPGYWWTGNHGQIDLIANMGFLVYGKPESFNSTLFLEARSEIDELDNLHNLGRFGLGLRFRF